MPHHAIRVLRPKGGGGPGHGFVTGSEGQNFSKKLCPRRRRRRGNRSRSYRGARGSGSGETLPDSHAVIFRQSGEARRGSRPRSHRGRRGSGSGETLPDSHNVVFRQLRRKRSPGCFAPVGRGISFTGSGSDCSRRNARADQRSGNGNRFRPAGRRGRIPGGRSRGTVFPDPAGPAGPRFFPGSAS